jgi:hypothetical protein
MAPLVAMLLEEDESSPVNSEDSGAHDPQRSQFAWFRIIRDIKKAFRLGIDGGSSFAASPLAG